MWKNSLSGWEADTGVNVTLTRRRQAHADAVKFYEQWLQKMHDQWDGKVKQTLVVQPLQRTLPVAAYLQTLALPDGITSSQVQFNVTAIMTRFSYLTQTFGHDCFAETSFSADECNKRDEASQACSLARVEGSQTEQRQQSESRFLIGRRHRW